MPLVELEGTAAELKGDYSPDNIELDVRAAFTKRGGAERFKACLDVLK